MTEVRFNSSGYLCRPHGIFDTWHRGCLIDAAFSAAEIKKFYNK